MQYLEEFLTTTDHHEIPVRVWRPKTVDKVLVIAHGMAEYCERYAPMADWLTESNIAVVALNHRGHGMDCDDEQLGYFAKTRGWEKVLKDLNQTIEFAKHEMPDVPVTLMGHSMGSFITQAFIQDYPEAVSGIILTSTNRKDVVKLVAAQALVGVIKTFKGPKATSKFVDFLGFGTFNRTFKPNRTEYDWLSRDNNNVDAYVEDPYCGYMCTNQMWHDFIGGILTIDYTKWPKELPVHLLSGTHDPVGEMSKGVTRLAEILRGNRQTFPTFKLYPEARHELTNETNSSEVWGDIRDIVLTGGLTTA